MGPVSDASTGQVRGALCGSSARAAAAETPCSRPRLPELSLRFESILAACRKLIANRKFAKATGAPPAGAFGRRGQDLDGRLRFGKAGDFSRAGQGETASLVKWLLLHQFSLDIGICSTVWGGQCWMTTCNDSCKGTFTFVNVSCRSRASQTISVSKQSFLKEALRGRALVARSVADGGQATGAPARRYWCLSVTVPARTAKLGW